MSASDNARMLLDAMADFTDDSTGNAYVPSQDRPPRLATVDPAYIGVGNPKVTFDGELTMSVKTYPYLDTKPAGGDRVAMLPMGRGYLLLGKVGVGAWYDALVARVVAIEDREWSNAVAGAISSSGSTATLNTTTGVVTIPAGCTQLRLDSLFQAGYEYELSLDLMVDSKDASSASSAHLRMREGGVTNSTAGYQTAGNYAQYNGVGGLYTINGGTLGAIGAVAGNGNYVDFSGTLRLKPWSASGLAGAGKAFFYFVDTFTNGSARGVRAGGYTPVATAAFDGIELWWNGSLTGLAQGKIRIRKRKLL